LGDVVSGLHTHEGIHLDAESLLNPQGHITGERGLTV
jgi:hypothetical protein